VVLLVAEPQRRVYVRRINVAGNTRTRDEVVRREFRQFESAWYDGRRSSCRATASTAWATSRT
jgi:outer membrane protein insertion porin family